MIDSITLILVLTVFTCAFSAEPTDLKSTELNSPVNPTATPVRPSVDPKIDKGELLGHIQFLSSPELRGREAGTPDQIKAAEYVASEFARYGLEPFGDTKDGKRTYFQEFTISEFKGVGKNSSMKISADGVDSPLEINKQFLPLAAGTKTVNADASVAFVGYGISAPELNYDDFAGVDLAGRWALILRYDPATFKREKNSDYSKYAPINKKILSCALRKAAGVLLVTGPLKQEDEKEEHALGKNVPGMIGDFHIPVIHITRSVADKLLVLTGKKIADLQIAIEADLKNHSLVIPGVKVAAVSEIEIEAKKTENVVARIGGSDPVLKKECVILGAHCDHVGMGLFGSLLGKDGVGKIHPGADDNASGTAGLLEIAQYIASLNPTLRPKRTILFMAFSGEERGLLGSVHYCEHPFIPLADTAAMVNLDMIGRSSDGAVQVSGIGSSKMFKDLITKDAEGVTLKVHLGGAGDGPSDHASFFQKNIPVLFFTAGLHADYHRPSDTWDKINAPVAEQTATLAAKVLLDLANRPDRPVFVHAGTGVYMGVGAEPNGYKGDGFPVGHVANNSPAEMAGIQKGDVISALNDQKIITPMDLNMSLTEFSPGDEIGLKVKRGTTTLELKVKLSARKAEK